MITRYQHTQIGYLLIFALAVAILAIAVLMVTRGPHWIGWLVLVTIWVTLLIFSTLTVAIRGGVLELRFGPGIIRKRFFVKDIDSWRIVKNPWYYGYGIRYTPHGWLFRVSGSYAVEIRMKTGATYRIGTDVPEELERAIRQARDIPSE
ncbi:hypothetical protein AMJ39_03945 [candidate division TA06 bacterium DG_24]|jgi:hypothetical protein|uniref:DUF5673 domain-containing protein n=3 Tax=Bacteria division TA06 TaxID=1156500 RepID=A0A0S8J7P1_UNCT6|nr:MAG: hypothetical protein AMJ39_03945 [candidate division TA06 bacterium DG_24]KPK70662.1 MAG: hypothetical protein AMJ82_02645 [candidate division TA06 bacterium SM23_40]KPL05791.1 MAG: hypothetical protein AMJ71_10970 [candidate division TA06 bacterium SM1_40]